MCDRYTILGHGKMGCAIDTKAWLVTIKDPATNLTHVGRLTLQRTTAFHAWPARKLCPPATWLSTCILRPVYWRRLWLRDCQSPFYFSYRRTEVSYGVTNSAFCFHMAWVCDLPSPSSFVVIKKSLPTELPNINCHFRQSLTQIFPKTFVPNDTTSLIELLSMVSFSVTCNPCKSQHYENLNSIAL